MSELGTAPPPATVSPQGPRRATVAFIFVTVLIDVMSFGLIIPVLPHLIEQFVGGGHVGCGHGKGRGNERRAV